MPEALVLEKRETLSLRNIDMDLTVRPRDVKIRPEVVGVCGSDVHYYQHGHIGPFVVNAPMVLGHEASGRVTEVGDEVTDLKVGDRVCVEPGIPDFSSKASRIGLYNLDPSLTFWATPPIHGCLTPEIVHPACLCYKLPDNVSMEAGAMVEPLAIAVQGADKAAIAPGDRAVVLGAGPIGLLMALTAVASGCSEVFIYDPIKEKMDFAERFDNITALSVPKESPSQQIQTITDGWGADLLFECSGAPQAYSEIADYLRPGGKIIVVGMPVDPINIDIVSLQIKEVTINTVFRYANVYDRAINLLSNKKIDVSPLITGRFPFKDSISAIKRAAEGRPDDIKLQIAMID